MTRNELKRGSETHHVPSLIFIPLFLLFCFPFLYACPPPPPSPHHHLFKNHAFKWKKGPLGQAKGHRSRFFPDWIIDSHRRVIHRLHMLPNTSADEKKKKQAADVPTLSCNPTTHTHTHAERTPLDKEPGAWK